jgi:uncharacterized protein (DUF302 family)
MTAKYTFGKNVSLKRGEALARVIEELAQQGFAVLTEIDVAATTKRKLGVDMAPCRILGECNPEFAHRALEIQPQIGALLPRNVVVRTDAAGATVVEVMDPDGVRALFGRPEITPAVAEVRSRIERRLQAVDASCLPNAAPACTAATARSLRDKTRTAHGVRARPRRAA